MGNKVGVRYDDDDDILAQGGSLNKCACFYTSAALDLISFF